MYEKGTPMRKSAQLILLFCVLAKAGFGQTPLPLGEQLNYCTRSGALPEQVNGYDPIAEDVATVRRLLGRLKLEANFSLLANNVVEVAAIRHRGERIILYHPALMKRVAAGEAEATGLLLQQMAHHLVQHPFTADGNERINVLEADRFTGFLLARLGIDWMEARSFLYARRAYGAPPAFFPPTELRAQFLREGYDDGMAVVDKKSGLLERSLAPDGISRLDAEAPAPTAIIPAFPFPPPRASASHDLPNALLDFPTTMDEVDYAISRAIDACGYVEKSYYGVPGGFALVTRLEQIDPRSGQPLDPPDRWSADIRWSGRFSIKEYLQALFFGRRGHFRVFVFLITNQPFYQHDQQVSKAEAEKWLRQGYNRLPSELGRRPYRSEHSCTVLVYEFQTDESGESRLVKLSNFSSHTHLERAGILAQLR